MSRYFILNEAHELVPVGMMDWARWFHVTKNRIVAKDELEGWTLSTVFLGLDHGWGDGPPVLFETMLFHGDWSGENQWRCCTWAEAEEQHDRQLALLKLRLAMRVIATPRLLTPRRGKLKAVPRA